MNITELRTLIESMVNEIDHYDDLKVAEQKFRKEAEDYLFSKINLHSKSVRDNKRDKIYLILIQMRVHICIFIHFGDLRLWKKLILFNCQNLIEHF